MAAPTELWGTFAVDDHVRSRPFVAEALLFDRLVIPTPPAWTHDELAKWPAAWQAGRLKSLLDVLGDRAIRKPWDTERHERWKAEYGHFKDESNLAKRQREAETVALDAEHIRGAPPDTPARVLTRDVLRNELNDAEDEELFKKIRDLPIPPAMKIEAVTAYGSLAQFRQDVDAQTAGGGAPQAEPRDALLLTWDVFVPEDTDLSDFQLLEKIVKLNENAEFVEHRARFQVLRREMLARKLDPLAAKVEIETRLALYNGILKSITAWQRARRFLTYAAAGVQLIDFVAPGVGMGAGVGLTLASTSWKSWAPNPKLGPNEQSVAMVHDLREAFHFG